MTATHILSVTLAVALIAISVVVHEIGHAVSLIRRGGTVVALVIGLGKPVTTWRIPHVPFPVGIAPIPLGAYVRHTDDTALTATQRVEFIAAGPLAQFAYGLGLFAVSLVPAAFAGQSPALLLLASSAILLAVCVWARRWICRYVVLPAGIALLATVIYEVAAGPWGAMSGPIGIGITVNSLAVSYTSATGLAGLVAASMAVTNLLPAVPLDGGHIAVITLQQWARAGTFANVFERWSSLLVAAMVAIACAGDIARLL